MPELGATITLLTKDGGTIHFSVANSGDVDWGTGDVAYRLDVTRDGTLVQQDSQVIANVPAGSPFNHQVSFLGAAVSGTYSLHLVVVDQFGGQTLATSTSEVTHEGPGGPPPTSNAGRAIAGSITHLTKDGATIFFGIRNGSDVDWQPGDVVYEFVCMRDNTVVQSENNTVGALAIGATFERQLGFEGAHLSATYVMAVTAVNQHTREIVATDSIEFEHTAP